LLCDIQAAGRRLLSFTEDMTLAVLFRDVVSITDTMELGS
jgi:hypothetical protein